MTRKNNPDNEGWDISETDEAVSTSPLDTGGEAWHGSSNPGGEPDPEGELRPDDGFQSGTMQDTRPYGMPTWDDRAQDMPAQDMAVRDMTQAPPTGTALVDHEALESMQAFRNLEEQRKRRKRRKVIKVIVVIAVVMVLLCAGIGYLGFKSAQNQIDASALETTTVTRGTFTTDVEASGSLEPYATEGVSPTVDGIIEEVYVSEGDSVESGQPLCLITNDALDDAVSEAEAALNAANAELANAKTSRSTAYDAYNHAVDEYNAAIAAGLEATFDEPSMRSSLDAAEAAVTSAQNAVDSARSAYDRAVENAARRTVYATTSGVVTAVRGKTGMSVGAATGTGSLFDISDVTAMRVKIKVNELDILDIVPGQDATVTFPAVGGYTASGTVESVATSASSAGQVTGTEGGSGGVVTFEVSVVVSEPDARLKPGMTADVTINTQTLDDVLIVPVNALIEDSDTGEYMITVVTDSSTWATEDRAVTVLAQNGIDAAIEGDIAEGDEVSTGMVADSMSGILG